MKTRSCGQIDVLVARTLAAYHKAYGVWPTVPQLAEVMGVHITTMYARLEDAASRNVVRHVQGTMRNWRPNPAYVPNRLREPRPYVNPHTYEVNDEYPTLVQYGRAA